MSESSPFSDEQSLGGVSDASEPVSEQEAPAIDEAVTDSSVEVADSTADDVEVVTEPAVDEVDLDDPAEQLRAALTGLPGDWYVVHSYAGYENKVKTNLESRISSLNMEDFIFQIEVPQEEVTDGPLARARLLDRDVLDRRLAAAVAQGDAATDHLGEHAHLAAALLEAAQVDEAGRDDLPRPDARHAADGEEHPAPAGHLDHEADHARSIRAPVDDQHVADLADLVARGVENGAPAQSGDEYFRGAHAETLPSG